MTSDDQDRFNPMTGEPIDRPSVPTTTATHHTAAGDIAAPGQVHADYDRHRTAPEPRDILLNTPMAKSMDPAEMIDAHARAREASLIEIQLPDSRAKVTLMPKSFDRVLADVSLTGIVGPAVQQSFYEAAKTLETMPQDEQLRLGEDTDAVLRAIGIGGSQDLYQVLTSTYPIACMVVPRCVPTEADKNGRKGFVSLERLTPDDRMAIVNACMAERGARAVALAPFSDAPAAP